MKFSHFVVTGLVALCASSAFAQTPAQDVRQDAKAVRQEQKEVHKDKVDLRKDRKELAKDRAQRNRDAKLEQRAVEKGNLPAAQKLDAKRKAEQKEIRADKKDVRADKTQLAKDRVERNAAAKDLRQDAAAK